MPSAADKAAANTEKRPRGRPFPKGKSGNPLGIAVVPPEERARRALERKEARRLARELELGRMQIDLMAREYAPLAVRVLAAVTRDGQNDEIRVRAAQALLDRGFGRPTEVQIVAAAVGVRHDGLAPLAEAMGALREVFAVPARALDHEPA